MKYTTIFFDRDNTLTYSNPEKKELLNYYIKLWSGREFSINYSKMIALFKQVCGTEEPFLKSISEEKEFYKKYYYCLLENEGITENLNKKSRLLFYELWNNNSLITFPETEPLLKELKNRNYALGVISDTFPSLELSLQNIGLAKYFSSFTSSSEVGVYKPDPKIFNVALRKHSEKAQNCIYVDDYDVESDGARSLGFTSFLIDREKKTSEEWTITSLTKILDFLDRVQK